MCLLLLFVFLPPQQYCLLIKHLISGKAFTLLVSGIIDDDSLAYDSLDTFEIQPRRRAEKRLEKFKSLLNELSNYIFLLLLSGIW